MQSESEASRSSLGESSGSGGDSSSTHTCSARSASIRHALSGGVAGAFSKTCTAPLARLVILYQVQAFSPPNSEAATTTATAPLQSSPLPFAAAAATAGTAAAPSSISGTPASARAQLAAQPSLREALMRVVRAEGVRSLWKGNLVTIIHRIPYSSINFYTYEATSRWLAGVLPPNSDVARRMGAGAMAGLVACSAAYPLDLVRTRLAAQMSTGGYYRGIRGTLRRIVADEGVAGLYRGMGATLLQVVPSLALSFTVYETARSAVVSMGSSSHQPPDSNSSSSSSANRLDSRDVPSARGTNADHSAGQQAAAGGGGGEWDLAQVLVQPTGSDATGSSTGPDSRVSSSHMQGLVAGDASGRRPGPPPPPRVSAAASLACGCLSGLVTATATFPLDVVRRRMQVEGQGHAGGGATYAGVMRQIWRSRGPAGFYAGITAEFCKVVPGVAIAYGTYEAMKQWTEAD